ncbi:MAG: hypothetical protein KBS34_05685 [Phascolarctobacterium sp.]|nr:hypothetical protein [Candidatus Phascolarctobacterium equi]
MRKRTPEQKKHNVLYQARMYKKRRLLLKALRFIQWLYIHRPAGIQPAQIRHVHIRIAHMLCVPSRWDDDDLRRAHQSLELVMKEIYNAKMGEFSGGYQDLLVALLDTLQIYNASTEDRANAIAELMFNVAVELHAVYGERKPDVSEPMLMALATDKPPYPRWVVDEMADFILSRFRQNESVHICNVLYEKLAKIIEAQRAVDVISQIQEDTTNEMVISGGGSTKGHCLS